MDVVAYVGRRPRTVSETAPLRLQPRGHAITHRSALHEGNSEGFAATSNATLSPEFSSGLWFIDLDIPKTGEHILNTDLAWWTAEHILAQPCASFGFWSADRHYQAGAPRDPP